MEYNGKKPKDVPVTNDISTLSKSLWTGNRNIQTSTPYEGDFIHYAILDTRSESILQSSKLITLPPT